MYRYYAFGLNIYSELYCPELLPATFAKADLEIRIANVAKTLDNCLYSRPGFDVNDCAILLRIHNVGRFLIENSRSINIQPEAKIDSKTIRLYLLGSCMGAVLHQRQMMPIHGSAVEHQNRALIICGRSGAGKSTTAAALAARGYRVLSDDISAIDLNQRTPLLIPGYPQMKLWKSAMDHFQFPCHNNSEVRPGKPKHAILIRDQFEASEKRVFTLLWIDKQDDCNPQLQKLSGSARFHAIRKNIYRKKYNFASFRGRYFNQCRQLSEQLCVIRLIRPGSGNSIETVADLVESHCLK